MSHWLPVNYKLVYHSKKDYFDSSVAPSLPQNQICSQCTLHRDTFIPLHTMLS